MKMRIVSEYFEGKVLLFEHFEVDDIRGRFAKLWMQNWKESFSIKEVFLSTSRRGVVRGLHYIIRPHAQRRIVTCIEGKMKDVVVDIRKRSPTYANYVAVDLDGRSNRSIFIGVGFAHGFLALEDCTVIYFADELYDKQLDRGIRWNDPQISIAWGVENPVVSERDSSHPYLKEADNNYLYGDLSEQDSGFG
jgi:dTDP-4-dehydrorhamnose 3,5-epimerase